MGEGYSVGSAFLEVVPSFLGVIEAIDEESRKWGDAAADGFAESFRTRVDEALHGVTAGPSAEDEARHGTKAASAFAEAFQARLDAARATLNVNVDDKGAGAAAANGGGLLSGLAGAALVVTPALLPIAGVLAGIGTAAVGAFSAAALGAGAFALAVGTSGAAAKAAAAKMEEAWRTSLAPFVSGTLERAVSLLPPLFSALTPVVEAVSRALNGVIGQFHTLEVSPLFKGAMSQLASEVGPLVTALGTLGTGALSGLMAGFAQMRPLISVVVQAIANIGPALAAFGSGGALGAFIKLVVANGPAVTGLLKELGGVFGALTSAVLPLGTALLPVISELAGLVKVDVVPFVAALAQAFAGVLPAIGSILPALGGIFLAVAPLVPVLGHVATILANGLAVAISSVLPVVEQLLPPFIALAASVLPPLATILAKFADELLPPLAMLFLAVGTPLIHLAQIILPPVVSLLGALLPPITKLVNELLPPLSSVLAVVGTVLDVVATALTSNKVVLDVVLIAIGALVAPVVTLAVVIAELAANWGTAWDAIKSAADAVFKWFLTNLRTYIVDPYLTMIGVVVNGAATAFGWVPGLGKDLKTAAGAFDNFKKSVDAALTPANTQFQALSANAAAFTAQVVAAGNAMRQLPDGTFSAASGGLKARAAGGPVDAGQPYLVGEQGPEYFVPGVSGSIVPDRTLLAALASTRAPAPYRMDPGSAGKGGLVIHEFTVNGQQDPQATAMETIQELQAVAYRLGL